MDKRGEKLSKSEQKIKEYSLKTSELLARYGKAAAITLAGKSLTIKDAKSVLSKESEITSHFFELIVEAEKKALKRRFW